MTTIGPLRMVKPGEQPRAPTELPDPGLFFGRPVRPIHLGIAIATGALGVQILRAGLDPHSLPLTVGIMCLISTAFFFVGWISDRPSLSEWALLLAAGTWTARIAYLVYQGNQWFSVAFSVAWVITAVGTWGVDRYHRDWKFGSGG